jgi:hypothetical protein
MAQQRSTSSEETTPRRRPLFAAAVAAALVLPIVSVLVTATVLAGQRPATQLATPGPTVTRTATPTPAETSPAPIVTGIPIESPDDPLLDQLTTDQTKMQACKFFLGNINSAEWSTTIEQFVSLFATAATLTTDEKLKSIFDAQVAYATKAGFPDNSLTADAVDACSSPAY